MWRTYALIMSFAWIAPLISGCTLIGSGAEPNKPTPSMNSIVLSKSQLIEIEAFLAAGSAEKLELDQLTPGKYVQLVTGSTPIGVGSVDLGDNVPVDALFIHSSSILAGTIKEAEGDRVVLSNVSLINESRTQTAVPILSKVPYVSRLFKNTGVGRSSTAIPGEVTINKSEILQASELTDQEFQSILMNGGHERIGIDFDFDISSESSKQVPQVSVRR